MEAAETQIKSAIKSSKSAAVKSSLIDQEVIFPFFLKTCYRGHIWVQGAPAVSQMFGTRKFKSDPIHLVSTQILCYYCVYRYWSQDTNEDIYIWMLSLSFSTLCVGQHEHNRNLFLLLSNSIGTGCNYLACAKKMHGYVLRCLALPALPRAMIS